MADVLQVARPHVYTLHMVGWLPGATRVPGPGRQWQWSGEALLKVARRQRPPRLDHNRFSPIVLWRVGCRCQRCRAAHASATTSEKRAIADALFSEEKRAQLLELVRAGTPVDEAAEQLSVSRGQVYGMANRDAEFRERLDEAGWALCQ
ncbi:hypothetical protein AB0K02_33230 [Streptomyces sp. NPDC049597]|uniref:helix-turn-helix domain-containing protein n=1 Tax=Streptomyces sp. NPDC049597 TaxID=3155276 RepID=UPI00341E4A16